MLHGELQMICQRPKKCSLAMRVMLAFSFSILTAPWMVGCAPKEVKPVEAPVPEVTAQVPEKKQITEFYEYIGRTEAPEFVEVRARVTGYLTKIHFADGKEVAAGEPLFEIDNRPYQFALDNAKARLKQADSQSRIASITLERNKPLLANNAISKQDMDELVERQVSTAAEMASAQAAVAQAELDLEFCSIKAPIAGRLSRASVTVGNLVSSTQINAPPLTTIAGVAPIQVAFDVDEAAVLRFRELRRQQGESVQFTNVRDLNQKVLVALSNETAFTHEGILDFIDNRTNPTTGTLLVRAVLENADRTFAPGFFVRVRVPFGDAKPSLLIPERAILSDQSIKYVLTVDSSNTVQRKDITLGTLDGAMRVVRSGLDESDRVIINGTQRARPGGKVNPSAAASSPQRGKE